MLVTGVVPLALDRCTRAAPSCRSGSVALADEDITFHHSGQAQHEGEVA